MSSTSSAGILQVLSSAIEQVAESTSSSVVSVSSNGSNGTGIVWDDQGHIVTAYHVVRGLDEVEIGLENGQTLKGSVVGRDRRSDIALLKVEGQLTPISKGDSSSLKVGQFVMALANPYASKASATSGIITSTKRSIGGWWGVEIEDAIVTDARVNPGYSGGPLVDASGKMVGMNVALVSSRGIAVPVQAISKVVERLASGKSIGRAYLGIIANPVELPADANIESKQEYGLMIMSVEQGSPAKAAGLALGDVLISFDGRAVSGFHDLTSNLTESGIGKTAKLGILRGGKIQELSITPVAAPESE